MTEREASTSRATYQTVGGAVAALLVGTIQMVYPLVDFPPGYEAALAVVCGAIVGWMRSRAR